MQHPSKLHFGVVKRVLRYVAGTIDYGICYSNASNFRLCGCTDRDWASSLDDRRSVSTNVFSFGLGAVTWSSKKQATTALSSSEAEYVAATSVACQAIWLRRILVDLHQRQEGPTEIFCDNKATIFTTKNPAFQSRTEHIDIRFHFIRGLVAKEEIILKYCNTMIKWQTYLQKLFHVRNPLTLDPYWVCAILNQEGVLKVDSRIGPAESSQLMLCS
ncbi:hypothetical protein JCGZ_01946 [Jatropha curcas]|uniref:Reverse transcriptase Ty1/copia-type domain-containing protein n=1 Tax=Jatropha curcas TaxID=180498 RepID=A0A067LCZ8_JATCU|nr:hypothetical protein JCGZ_01946 [Jatropha curcas]